MGGLIWTNGPCTFYYAGGDKIECTWINGSASGTGTRYFVNGDRLECTWRDGKIISDTCILYSPDARCY